MQDVKSFKLSIRRFILIQVIIVSIFSFFISFFGIKTFYSSLLGGTICILGNVCMAINFIKNKFNHKKFLYSFYLSEVAKFIVTIVFFVISIKCLSIQFLPFLLSYIITQNTFWFSPFLFK